MASGAGTRCLQILVVLFNITFFVCDQTTLNFLIKLLWNFQLILDLIRYKYYLELEYSL